MSTLGVKPGHLEELAKDQDTASAKSKQAAGAASKIESSVWVTHGVISGVSNTSFTNAERARSAAGGNIAATSADLAAKLRTAARAYEGVDSDLSANVDKQILPR
jgi:ESX secretion-associated protein EspC/F